MNFLLKLELFFKLEFYWKEIEKICKFYIYINMVMNSLKLYESKFGGNFYFFLEVNYFFDF